MIPALGRQILLDQLSAELREQVLPLQLKWRLLHDDGQLNTVLYNAKRPIFGERISSAGL